MNGVAVIDRVTIDCIFSGMVGFGSRGGALYGSVLHDPGRGAACVTPVRLGNMGVPVRYSDLFGSGLAQQNGGDPVAKYKVQNLHNFMTATGSR